MAGVAALVALGLLLVGGQITPTRWYGANPAYRAQVDSFLAGHLALSDAPEAVFHDFAWTDTGVQQVWGLGVPAWQTPFELAGRVVGVTPFPDRVPLLCWLALMIYVLVRAWWRRAEEPWWIGAGAIVITALLPAVVTLVRGRFGIYEEAALYAYGAAMLLLGGMLRLFASPSRVRFIVLLAVAGLAAFIRPTAGVYGLATAIVASAWWLGQRGRRGLIEVALGGALFLAGGAALYATNAARFGDGLEFGHKLNLQGLPGNIYATRFSYPMQRAGIAEAAVELGASLFDRPELRARGSFFQKHLHHGVSKRIRWREYYFTTFSWAYVPLLLAGLVLGVLAWRRRATPTTGDPETRWLVAWTVIALVPLLAFYLRAPFVSSRYQIDIAPAFAALIVVAWRAGARWVAARHRLGAHIACGVLVGAWIFSVATARTAEPRSANPVDHDTAAAAMAPITGAVKHARTFPAAYDLADPWLPAYTDIVQTFDRCAETRCLHGERATPESEQWVITEKVNGAVVATHRPAPALYLNLYRWNLDTGLMPPASFAFVDDPRFVELEVSVAQGTPPADWSREVQVAVGLVQLRLASTTPSARGVTLRFEAPELPRGLQVAYFAFGPDDELAKLESRIVVHRIRWK
jgi:hypothetical protein